MYLSYLELFVDEVANVGGEMLGVLQLSPEGLKAQAASQVRHLAFTHPFPALPLAVFLYSQVVLSSGIP